MSSNRRDLRFWASAWGPVAIGIAAIAIESTEWFGADHTSGPLRMVFEALFGHVSDAHWNVIHHFTRKTGHFVGYGLIGLAWLRAWRMNLPCMSFLTDASLALFGTALVASCDEWHQSYLPNRTSSAWDVLIDCSGAFALTLLVYLFLRRRKMKQLTDIG